VHGQQNIKTSKLNLLRIYRYIKVQSYASLITSVTKITTNYPTVWRTQYFETWHLTQCHRDSSNVRLPIPGSSLAQIRWSGKQMKRKQRL